ncbi:unnamed protein product, partial [Durusdinium trenchii]
TEIQSEELKTRLAAFSIIDGNEDDLSDLFESQVTGTDPESRAPNNDGGRPEDKDLYERDADSAKRLMTYVDYADAMRFFTDRVLRTTESAKSAWLYSVERDISGKTPEETVSLRGNVAAAFAGTTLPL